MFDEFLFCKITHYYCKNNKLFFRQTTFGHHIKLYGIAFSKGHFFSDDSALTNRPDAKAHISFIF